MTRGRVLRVLQAIPDPAKRGHLNPYNTLLASSLPQDVVSSEYLRWPLTLARRFDILHVHWPENLVRHSTTSGKLIKRALALALLARVAVSQKQVVRTIHNLQPHEPGDAFEAWFVEQLARRTSHWIRLNPATPTPDPARTTTILHGHYGDWYAASDEPQIAGTLLCFGLIRAYKGIDALVLAATELGDASTIRSVRIVGKASEEDIATLRSLAGHCAAVNFSFGFASDLQLAAEIARSEAVILPYRNLHNSGAALLALSLGRPLIVPSNEATVELQREFGDEWVILMDGDLSGSSLEHALDQVRSRARTSSHPPLAQREWAVLGRQLADVYMTTRSRAEGTARATSHLL